MFFLYSRKPQFLLLLCWCLGLAGMCAYAIGGEAWDLERKNEKTEQARVNLGENPPVAEAPPPPAADPPPEPEQPPADPRLNRFTALRIISRAGGDEKKLVLEADYIAARTHGFTPDKAHGYYFLDGGPTVVVALGHPWVTDVEQEKFPVADMPQVKDVRLFHIQPEELRLFVNTHTALQASGARVRIEPTPAGLRAEIYFTR